MAFLSVVVILDWPYTRLEKLRDDIYGPITMVFHSPNSSSRAKIIKLKNEVRKHIKSFQYYTQDSINTIIQILTAVHFPSISSVRCVNPASFNIFRVSSNPLVSKKGS